MKKVFFLASVLFLYWGASSVNAESIKFGGGVYTNLCGSGTAADAYRCDKGCNPETGICKSDNNGVVKYTCSGRWEQCLESESSWSSQIGIGNNVACGNTVQVSLYDKKCRKAEDGSWDNSCKLLGYMVWYSGECRGGGPTPTAAPTSKPAAATPTSSPTQPAARPTVTPTAIVGGICGKRCSSDLSCGAGFGCSEGVCRNPSCVDDSDCFCGSVAATGSGSVVDKSPETGASVILMGILGLVFVGVGVAAFRYSFRIW